MTDLTKVMLEEKDGEIFIYRPQCPICHDNMVQGRFEYFKDLKDTNGFGQSTFQPERLYKRLIYVCKKHLNNRVELTSEEIGLINTYFKDKQHFVSYPKVTN